MLRFLLFLLFFLPFSYEKQWRMMLIYGKPGITNQYFISIIGKSMEECYTLCYNTNECAVSYHYGITCQLFKFGNYSITQLNSSSEKVVGIKRLLQDDQCPDLSKTSYSSIDTWRGANNSAVMLNEISKSGIQWSITYNYLACDNRTQLFRRDNYWVCIGARAFSDGCGSYNAAMSLCKGGGISLTGPYSSEEKQFLYDSRGSYPGYNALLWVDGRNGVYKDPTVNNGINYSMCRPSDRTLCHYIDTGNCVNTFDCFKSTNNRLCWHGAACLMKYLKIY